MNKCVIEQMNEYVIKQIERILDQIEHRILILQLENDEEYIAREYEWLWWEQPCYAVMS